MKASSGLPPFRVIEAALRATTERLVREIGAPSATAPDWNGFEWTMARAACAIHGISALLASRLHWRGPAEFHDFLATQFEYARERDRRIGALLERLDATFAGAGIPFIALKGSALRHLSIYQPGERPQSDVDLLVHVDDLSACRQPLQRVGYRFRYASRRHDVYGTDGPALHAELGEHPDNPLNVEVHTRVAENLPVEAVDITALVCPVFGDPGAGRYASVAALLRHLALHTAAGMRANAMRFIQLYDLAQLARRMGNDDWRELIGPGAARARSWWLFPPLALAARYLPGAVPAPVLEELSAVCPRRLRRRAATIAVHDVSWSNLRIAALPGREWARTLGDTLRFARHRLFPARAALDELVAGTVAAQPHLARVPWYGVSHAERVLRWTFSRPPRVQTLAVVAAALREAAP